MQYIERATRNLFFTGKGGVGKTSLACASAIALADRGARVLLVSTDPASNLDEVLGVPLGTQPTSLPAVPRLVALNIDPEESARVYREKVVGPYRGVFPESVLTSMEEQLSGACTVEIAAFDEFSRLLSDPRLTSEFDHVVFDTAPTGHTLRLLSLPSAWTGYIETNTTGTSCLGPLAGLEAQRQLYQAAVAALADADRTTLILVTRPDPAALAEADRSRHELAALGLRNQQLVVNGVFRARSPHDPVAAALQHRTRESLAAMPAGLESLPRSEFPLLPHNLLGVTALRAMFDGATVSAPPDGASGAGRNGSLPPSLMTLVDELANRGRGVILTMGKGGVGKTTVAAAVAVELVRRGHDVHLTTTDPAAHVQAVVGNVPPGLSVSRIDPEAQGRGYRSEVLATAGASLDAQGRALLEEDLRSPCTQEIAVFRAFAKVVDQGRDGFVVLDTAPTGHTILLLDAALAYHRELSRQASGIPDAVRQLLPRLRDPDYTRILIVTVPEATPVHEAGKLQDDLLRAGIHPYAWVINQSLSPLTVQDPVLLARQHCENKYIHEVVQKRSTRTALIPWLLEPPVGSRQLSQVLQCHGGG